MEPKLIFIGRNQLRWYGHVMRRDENRTPVKYYSQQKIHWKTLEKMERFNTRFNMVSSLYSARKIFSDLYSESSSDEVAQFVSCLNNF